MSPFDRIEGIFFVSVNVVLAVLTVVVTVAFFASVLLGAPALQQIGA
jgi:hypothetical protein